MWFAPVSLDECNQPIDKIELFGSMGAGNPIPNCPHKNMFIDILCYPWISYICCNIFQKRSVLLSAESTCLLCQVPCKVLTGSTHRVPSYRARPVPQETRWSNVCHELTTLRASNLRKEFQRQKATWRQLSPAFSWGYSLSSPQRISRKHKNPERKS